MAVSYETSKAFAHLRDMYHAAWHAPEAFRMEYGYSVHTALELISGASALELEGSFIGGDAWGENALHFAAGCGCIEGCEILLRRHARLNFQQDRHGATPLLWAVRHGMLRVVDLLLRHGAVADHADGHGLTTLHIAAALGYARMCDLLLSVPSLRNALDRQDMSGQTALHAAAAGGSASSCHKLLNSHADIAARTLGDERTPLHLASLAGHVEVVRELMKHGGSCLHLDAFDQRPVDLASEKGHDRVASLLQNPVDMHHRLVNKWSCMMNEAGAQAHISHADHSAAAALELSPPVIQRVRSNDLELVCDIVDLEFRIIEYVIEVHRCGGPNGAAPARLYYARMSQQRKIDRVSFQIPRTRQSGLSIWVCHESFQFRVTGRVERSAAAPEAPWQAVSEWSSSVELHIQAGRSTSVCKALLLR